MNFNSWMPRFVWRAMLLIFKRLVVSKCSWLWKIKLNMYSRYSIPFIFKGCLTYIDISYTYNKLNLCLKSTNSCQHHIGRLSTIGPHRQAMRPTLLRVTRVLKAVSLQEFCAAFSINIWAFWAFRTNKLFVYCLVYCNKTVVFAI